MGWISLDGNLGMERALTAPDFFNYVDHGSSFFETTNTKLASFDGLIKCYQSNPKLKCLKAFTGAGYCKTYRTLTVTHGQCSKISPKCKASCKEQFVQRAIREDLKDNAEQNRLS